MKLLLIQVSVFYYYTNGVALLRRTYISLMSSEAVDQSVQDIQTDAKRYYDNEQLHSDGHIELKLMNFYPDCSIPVGKNTHAA